MHALLQQFQKRERHSNVARLHQEDGANLGTWVNHQRQLKRKETPDSDSQKMLEDIGFEWASSPTWDEMPQCDVHPGKALSLELIPWHRVVFKCSIESDPHGCHASEMDWFASLAGVQVGGGLEEESLANEELV
jgi:hypothetical protein